jgi:hypothetical protein
LYAEFQCEVKSKYKSEYQILRSIWQDRINMYSEMQCLNIYKDLKSQEKNLVFFNKLTIENIKKKYIQPVTYSI